MASSVGCALLTTATLQVRTSPGRDQRLFHVPLSKDTPVAALFELLGRQYACFGDWQTAAECFTGRAMYRPR